VNDAHRDRQRVLALGSSLPVEGLNPGAARRECSCFADAKQEPSVRRPVLSLVVRGGRLQGADADASNPARASAMRLGRGSRQGVDSVPVI
jgi:hypothetical protein